MSFIEVTNFCGGLRKLAILPLSCAEVAVRTSPDRYEVGLWSRQDKKVGEDLRK